VSAGWLSGKTDGKWRVRTRSRAPWIPTRFCTYIACSSRGVDIGACYVCFRLPHVLMNPGKLLSPRHSPSCGPLKQQQLGDQDERHPGPRRASEQKRAMAARIAASSFSSAPSSPRLERRGAPGSKREPTTEEVRPARTSSWGGLHRDFCRHPSHLCPYSSRFLFFFLAPFDVRPGPGYAWPRRGSWVPTLIRGLPSRGTPAKKNRRRSAKPCRCANHDSGRYAGLGERKSHFLQ